MEWLSKDAAIAIPPGRSRTVTIGADVVCASVNETVSASGVRDTHGDIVARHILSSCVKGEGVLGALSMRHLPSPPSDPSIRPPPRPTPNAPRFIFLLPPRVCMGVDAFAKPMSEEKSEAPTPLRTSTAWLPKVVDEADVLAQPDARTKSGTPAATIRLGVFSEAVGAIAKSEPRVTSAAPTASRVPSTMTTVGTPPPDTCGRVSASSSCSLLPEAVVLANSSLPVSVSSTLPPPHPPPVVDDAPAEARTQSGPPSPRVCSVAAKRRAARGGSRRTASDAVEWTTSTAHTGDAVQERGGGSANRPMCTRNQSAGGSAACHIVAAPAPSPDGTR